MNFHEMKIAFKEWLLASLLYVFIKLITCKRYFHRILWLFFIIASSASCSWYIFQSFQNFLSYPVVTNIESKYETPIQFPAVLFCSDSFINETFNDLILECNFHVDFECKDELEKFNEFPSLGCFSFNTGTNKDGHAVESYSSTIGGLDDCFHLKIYAPDGLTILIYNDTYKKNVEYEFISSGDVLFASSGFKTNFIIDKTFEFKLEEPYNRCFKNVSLFSLNKTIIDFLDKINATYNQDFCLDLCYELDFLEKNQCNCTNAKLGDASNCFSSATNNSKSSCFKNLKKSFFKGKYMDKCAVYCPLECDSVSYKITPNAILLTKNDINSTNYVEINIYYRSLWSTMITQQPKMVISDLISNIGGLISLFVGFSFITICELIQLITELLFISFEDIAKREISIVKPKEIK